MLGLSLALLVSGWACGFLSPATPLESKPSITSPPLPTYTLYPTYTPWPTPSPAEQVIDIAQRHDLVDAINEYRTTQGRPVLRVSGHLMHVAASRVYLGLIPVDLGQVAIDPRVMPPNYRWREWAAWGNAAELRNLQTPEAILEYWLSWQGMPDAALRTDYTEIGAAYLCDSVACAFVIIYGGP